MQTTASVVLGCDNQRRELEVQVLLLLCHGRTFLEVEAVHGSDEIIVLLDPMPWTTFRDQPEVAFSPDRNPGQVVTLSKKGQNLQGSLAGS